MLRLALDKIKARIQSWADSRCEVSRKVDGSTNEAQMWEGDGTEISVVGNLARATS